MNISLYFYSMMISPVLPLINMFVSNSFPSNHRIYYVFRLFHVILNLELSETPGFTIKNVVWYSRQQRSENRHVAPFIRSVYRPYVICYIVSSTGYFHTLSHPVSLNGSMKPNPTPSQSRLTG